MNILVIIARYILCIIYLFGAYDGAAYLLFDTYLHGEPEGIFLIGLQGTTYFWVLLKLIELIGGLSLLFNYKPALGIALLTPITAVLSLFYLFTAEWYIAFCLVVIPNLILLYAYADSFKPLLDNHSWKKSTTDTLEATLEQN
jgi:hypothetical protein